MNYELSGGTLQNVVYSLEVLLLRPAFPDWISFEKDDIGRAEEKPEQSGGV